MPRMADENGVSCDVVMVMDPLAAPRGGAGIVGFGVAGTGGGGTGIGVATVEMIERSSTLKTPVGAPPTGLSCSRLNDLSAPSCAAVTVMGTHTLADAVTTRGVDRVEKLSLPSSSSRATPEAPPCTDRVTTVAGVTAMGESARNDNAPHCPVVWADIATPGRPGEGASS